MIGTKVEGRPSTNCPGRVLAIVNPRAGSAEGGVIHRSLTVCFAEGESQLEGYEAAEEEDLGSLVRHRIAAGVDLVVAVGGDGTVGAVADAMVGSGTPLGIIPMGTANVLACELNIPLDPRAASRLLVADHELATIDAMRVGERHYFTQVGVGLDALMIRDTQAESKRRFGKSAYLWTAATHLFGHQPLQFFLEIDGQTRRTRASDVIVANVGTLGQPPLRWGPDIRLDDGTLDVCVCKAKSLVHYGRLFWHVISGQPGLDPNVRYYPARQSVSIATSTPVPVQADGEVLGETPVRIEVVPGALQVIVPKR